MMLGKLSCQRGLVFNAIALGVCPVIKGIIYFLAEYDLTLSVCIFFIVQLEG